MAEGLVNNIFAFSARLRHPFASSLRQLLAELEFGRRLGACGRFYGHIRKHRRSRLCNMVRRTVQCGHNAGLFTF